MERENHISRDNNINTVNDRVDNEFIAFLDPGEYIDLMFERTYADDGCLYEPVFDDTRRLPGTEYHEDLRSLRFCHDCVMDWSEADRDRVKAECEALCHAFSEIAKLYDYLGNTEKENEKLLSPELMKVWSTYIRRFNAEQLFDLRRIADIHDRCKAK